MNKESVMNVLKALKESYRGSEKDFEIINNTIKLIETLIDEEIKRKLAEAPANDKKEEEK